jgi:Na+/phosphate symporter
VARCVWRGRYDDQFIKLRRALGIIAGTNVATTMTMLLSAL